MTPATVRMIHTLLEAGWHFEAWRHPDMAGGGGRPVDPAYPEVHAVCVWRFDASGTRAVSGRGRHGELADALEQAIGGAIVLAEQLGVPEVVAEIRPCVTCPSVADPRERPVLAEPGKLEGS